MQHAPLNHPRKSERIMPCAFLGCNATQTMGSFYCAQHAQQAGGKSDYRFCLPPKFEAGAIPRSESREPTEKERQVFVGACRAAHGDVMSFLLNLKDNNAGMAR